MPMYPSFSEAIARVDSTMRERARSVHTEKWQGINIADRPEAEMRELIDWSFKVPMGSMLLSYYQEQIRPNLPWADEHFLERVCGYPMNPGESWKNWPFARSAEKFLGPDGKFEVNYMERMWCGRAWDKPHKESDDSEYILTGIRDAPYGDMQNVIDLLAREPTTRQAYLPMFHPEDTGGRGRAMCSLGYFWIMRGGFLHVYYPIRSCDFYRHFRDDCYLTVRLTIWLLERLREKNPAVWDNVRLGFYSMWIGSLHIFINDAKILWRKPRGE